MISRVLRFAATGVFLLWACDCEAQLVGYDAGGAVFAEIDHIDPDTGVPSPPPEYLGCYTDPTNVWFGGGDGGTGFTVGFAYVGEVLYGLEFEGGGYYLYTTGVDGFGCARATRVGGELGAPGLEFNSLAYCAQDDVLYTHAFQPSVAPHRGQLYTLDRATGVGTPVGSLTGSDFRVTGLSCDPTDGILYGITTGYASRFPNSELVTLDRTDSSVTPIGTTGIPAAGMQTNAESLAMIVTGTGESLQKRLFAGGAQLWELDLDTGAATAIGSPDSFNGQLFALAHRSTGGPGAGPTATPTNTGEATSVPTATATDTAAPTPTPSQTEPFVPTATPSPTTSADPSLTLTPTEVPLTPIELLDLLGGYRTGAVDSETTLWRRSLDWYRPN